MKTLKQIADELGVSKQQVYRAVIRHHIIASAKANQTCLYDAEAEAAITGLFQDVQSDKLHHADTNEAHHGSGDVLHSDAVMQILQAELQAKNQQIAVLQEQLGQLTEALASTTTALQAAQALHAGTMAQLPEGLKQKKQKKKKKKP